jgi:hypothetical protein
LVGDEAEGAIARGFASGTDFGGAESGETLGSADADIGYLRQAACAHIFLRLLQ